MKIILLKESWTAEKAIAKNQLEYPNMAARICPYGPA